MKVSTLIKKLQELPPHLRVAMFDGSYFVEVTHVQRDAGEAFIVIPNNRKRDKQEAYCEDLVGLF